MNAFNSFKDQQKAVKMQEMQKKLKNANKFHTELIEL